MLIQYVWWCIPEMYSELVQKMANYQVLDYELD